MTAGHPFRMDHNLFKLCQSKDELIIFSPKPKAFHILGDDAISQARNLEVISIALVIPVYSMNYFLDLF